MYSSILTDPYVGVSGGKAHNLALLSEENIPVPRWFCLTENAYQTFISYHNLTHHLAPIGPLKKNSEKIENIFLDRPLPPSIQDSIEKKLIEMKLDDTYVAVRSSGLDEDTDDYAFAGLFSSFLYQKGIEEISLAIRKCWASLFSERGLSYRIKNGLPLDNLQIAVIIQKMVNATTSGVAFSKDPVHHKNQKHILIHSLWGSCEGLVSGMLDADQFLVDQHTFDIEKTIVKKKYSLGHKLKKETVADADQNRPSLTEEQLQEVAKLVLALEHKNGRPQDCEWAYEGDTLYCLQTRPITTLPPKAFYNVNINGNRPTLWDNSNIIESYCGVTSPLTFSFANRAYSQVYRQFCEVIGTPKKIINAYGPVFRNMLGFIRGRIYYNLINWYKLAVLLPGTSQNQEFLETMMGVKETLPQQFTKLFDFTQKTPPIPWYQRLSLIIKTGYRFFTIDKTIKKFFKCFNNVYGPARKIDFQKLSLPEQLQFYEHLEKQLLHRWRAPIINDAFCMIFFGLLKKLTKKWISNDVETLSLQNDLLCGEGDLESTKPTKMLMKIAKKISNGDANFKKWFLTTTPQEIWDSIHQKKVAPQYQTLLKDFIDLYGFRCVNELKLEEPDLHDDPTFIINTIISYIRTKSYNIQKMEQQEAAIRTKAENIVHQQLRGWKKVLYLWILKQTRHAIKNRENLRFARTKIFGIIRHLFRATGNHLKELNILDDSQDIFYLTIDEIFEFIEGKPTTIQLNKLANIRKQEFSQYKTSPPPPDRFLTYGATGISIPFKNVLADGNLQRNLNTTDDPNLLIGTPCCPGTVEGEALVANTPQDAQHINKHILITERTDPGWVPLYPACSGLLIERGSLLSHSAVVARELGIPTIVSIQGGLMTKIQSGQKIRINATEGTVYIHRE